MGAMFNHKVIFFIYLGCIYSYVWRKKCIYNELMGVVLF